MKALSKSNLLVYIEKTLISDTIISKRMAEKNWHLLICGREYEMADSNITKQALAAALKELMQEFPFEKINVAHICEKCGMNRKSFYYHFKDKYELVNWIFDTGFIEVATSSTHIVTGNERWAFIECVSEYFYADKEFYRKALRIKGQNSFEEHFREYIFPILKNRLVELLGKKEVDDFVVDFLSDAVVCAIERWLLDKKCMEPKQFVEKIKMVVQNVANTIHRERGEEAEGDA